MAFKFLDRARMTTATTGTGTITLGSAVSKFQSFAAAGIANADTIHYVIEDGTAWEIGTGTYTSVGTTLSRSLLASSTGSLLTLSGSAEVFAGLIAADNIDPARVMTNDTQDQVIAGGARVTVLSLGNLSGASITPDPGDRPIQSITNNGAGSVLPGTNYGTYLLQIINASGAGAITSTGWTLKGDAFDTTTTSKFLCSCVVTANLSLMSVIKVA